jgi:DNA-binding NarL/FixJ family response regulator
MNDQNVLVVDDHPLVARGIADFIQFACGFNQSFVATSTGEFWDLLRKEPDIALAVIDFWLPEGASLALISECKTTYPDLPLLVMSADDSPYLQTKVKGIGANGFLLKNESPEKFVEAVNLLRHGKNRFFNKYHLNGDVFYKHELLISAKELGLTQRQGEVLMLILEGHPNKRIAQILELSENTVKEHITGILEKLGVRNRIELITKLHGKRIS